MNEWTWGDSAGLVARAYCWLVGVTVPAGMVLAFVVQLAVSAAQDPHHRFWGPDLELLVLFAFWAAVIVAVVAVGGAVVALHCTHVLGLLLRRVRCRALHVVATAVLAGVLGAVTAGAIGAIEGVWAAQVLGSSMGASTGVAGAIARWRQLRARAREAAAPRPSPSTVTS
jgi:hypothetical protein